MIGSSNPIELARVVPTLNPGKDCPVCFGLGLPTALGNQLIPGWIKNSPPWRCRRHRLRFPKKLACPFLATVANGDAVFAALGSGLRRRYAAGLILAQPVHDAGGAAAKTPIPVRWVCALHKTSSIIRSRNGD